MKEFDSAHALIQAKYLGVTGDNHSFEWRFSDFYMNKSKGIQGSNSRVYEMIAGVVSRCPVRFSISKSNFELKILNEAQLDSISGIVSVEMVKKMPHKKTKEDRELAKEMLEMMFALKVDKAIYDLIRKYYSIYQKQDLQVNEKTDIKSAMKKNGNRAFAAGAEGFAILDGTDPGYYNYKYESVMDMGKMLGQLSKSLSTNDSTATTSMKKGKSNVEMVMKGEIKISRPDMIVSSYYEYESSNGNLFARDVREREMTLVRAIK